MKRCIENGIRSFAVLSLATAAWSVSSVPALADTNQGLYAGGGVGRYDIRIDNAEEFGSVIDHYSTNDTAYQFFAGWRFAPFLSLEGQYMNLGTNRSYFGPGEQLQNKIYGWAPWVVGTLPLGSTAGQVVGPFELFAKAGEYWYQYHTSVRTPFGGYSSSSDTFNHFVYGGGVGLVFLQRLDVRLEYDELKIQRTNTSNALWLTAAFNF